MTLVRCLKRAAVCSARWCALLVMFVAVPSSAVAGVDPEGAGQAVGEVDLAVAIGGADLVLDPVAELRFKVFPVENTDFRYLVTTGTDGTANLALKPGQYVIRSESPLERAGTQYDWEVRFPVLDGKRVRIFLSDHNARIEERTPRAVELELDEAEIYRLARGSVFEVLSESGQGSGFLVDSAGLVLTNHHLVASSEALTVTVDELRYRARLLAADAVNDLAVLQLNPIVVEQLEPLVLTTDDPTAPPCAVGERVLALGSTQAVEAAPASGLVRRVGERAIYSDLQIAPGDSGGPLFNMRGEVIGVNTYGPALDSASGVVRLHLAEPLLESARSRNLWASSPPADPLPVPSSF